MFRRSAESTERLCRRGGHDVSGYVDGRLPRQFLEVRAARDLREYIRAGWPEWLADGPETRRASVSDKTAEGGDSNECNEKTSRFTHNRASRSSRVRDSRSCGYKLETWASADDSGRRDARRLLRGSCQKLHGGRRPASSYA